jgi:hypothetical protein
MTNKAVELESYFKYFSRIKVYISNTIKEWKNKLVVDFERDLNIT